MPKLSDPQKRVLGAMAEFDSIVSMLPWGGRWDISTIPDLVGGSFRPRLSTLRVLVRLGLLGHDHIGALESEFYLTPKGHKLAKELQDAKTK